MRASRLKSVRHRSRKQRSPGESAQAMVARLAQAKARAAAEQIATDAGDCIVVGADTTVELDGEILGKPRDAAHAREMLAALGGRAHRVLTGIFLVRLPDGAYARRRRNYVGDVFTARARRNRSLRRQRRADGQGRGIRNSRHCGPLHFPNRWVLLQRGGIAAGQTLRVASRTRLAGAAITGKQKGQSRGPPRCLNFTGATLKKLLLFLGRRSGGGCSGRRHLRCLRRGLPRAVHAFLETADPFTQAAHHFRDLLATEQKDYDGQHNQPMKWAEFSHKVPAF